MKTRMTRIAGRLFAGMSLLIAAAACMTDPVTPEDQRKKKVHEEPSKISVKLVECHVHGAWEDIQTDGGLHQNAESPARYMKRQQEISYELVKGEGWRLSEGSQERFYVQQNGEYRHDGKLSPAPVYLLFVEYYNLEGELMNAQFNENGQDLIHQHFFTPVDVRPTADGIEEADDKDPSAIVDYLYADTDPWNETVHSGKAKIIGKENPIGLKGVIRFLKGRKEFKLKMRLYHGYESKINPRTGVPDPFYKPSPLLIQRGTWDVNFDIPVTVFWSKDDLVDLDPEADIAGIPEDGLDAGSNKVIHSIMTTFGISWKEALQEFIDYTYRSGEGSGAGSEGGHLWL